MSSVVEYELVSVAGLKKSQRRQIAFLQLSQCAELNAYGVFSDLPLKTRRTVLSRFDYWIDGGINKKYFHGWDYPPYKDCFVFKWVSERVDQRIYGFLHHPLPKTNPGFELCVLCSHAPKTRWETDPSELKSALAFACNADVTRSIVAMFPDKAEADR